MLDTATRAVLRSCSLVLFPVFRLLSLFNLWHARTVSFLCVVHLHGLSNPSDLGEGELGLDLWLRLKIGAWGKFTSFINFCLF